MDVLQINTTLNLVQKIRLVHALTESDYPVSIPMSDEYKFDLIRERFGIQFADSGSSTFDVTGYLNISHEEPITAVGRIVRPLIFPHAITNYCRSLWADRRKHRYSFQGRATSTRKPLLESWIENKLDRRVRLSDPVSIPSKVRRRLFNMGLNTTKKRRIGELLLWESDRGRMSPIKAWDDEYFRVLADSAFVLCPSGGFIWSYRFFESALCGAIPIVEEDCGAYSGFRYFSFHDDVANLEWSVEDADYNYRLCVERLTVPGEVLNDEIARILKSGG